MNLGKIAYEAYVTATGGVSLKKWDELSEELKEAWESSADAARRSEPPPVERCYSHDGGHFFEDPDGVVSGYAENHLFYELPEGEALVFELAQAEKQAITPEDVLKWAGDQVLDYMQEAACELAGEAADGWLTGWPVEKADAFRKWVTGTVWAWLAEQGELPTFWKVGKVRPWRVRVWYEKDVLQWEELTSTDG